MNNSFSNQFSENIKFKYFCFDRVIIRGYILSLFFPAGIVRFLRAIGFKGLSNGVMRILTDQLNGHIQKVAKNKDIPIHWCLPALPAPYDERWFAILRFMYFLPYPVFKLFSLAIASFSSRHAS